MCQKLFPVIQFLTSFLSFLLVFYWMFFWNFWTTFLAGVCQCSFNVNNMLTCEPIRQNWNSWGFFFKLGEWGGVLPSATFKTDKQFWEKVCSSAEKETTVQLHSIISGCCCSEPVYSPWQTSEFVLREIGSLLILNMRSLGLWTNIWYVN